MCSGNCSECTSRTCETIPTCDESTKNWEHCETYTHEIEVQN